MDIFTQNIGAKEQRLYTNKQSQRGLGLEKKEANPIAHALRQVKKFQEKNAGEFKRPTPRRLKRGLSQILPQRTSIALKKRILAGQGLKLAGAGVSMAGGAKYGTHPCPSYPTKPARLPMRIQTGEGKKSISIPKGLSTSSLTMTMKPSQKGKGFKKFIKQFPERLTTTAMTGYPAIIPGTPVLSDLVGRGSEEYTGYAKGVLVQRPDQSGTGLSMPTFKGIVASGCDWAVGKLVDAVEELTGVDMSDVEKRIEGYMDAAQEAVDQGEAALQQAQQQAETTSSFGTSQFGYGITGDIRKELKKIVPRFRKDIGEYALMAANKILPKIGLDPRENPGIQRALAQGIGRISRAAVKGQRGQGIQKSIRNLGQKIAKGLKKGTKHVKRFIAKNPELMTALQVAGAVAPLAMM